ncbi:PHP domain-containing protein [Brevibacterium litoralis]|uniref:PHP domain-containing protein n=1 Tax=Brevibacterium litoralis TaxID=3138935 RepID=UPI0032EB8C4B
MVIDIHTHSRFSDGTQSPAELVAEAAEGGVDVIGLTDHDTTAGWSEAAEAAAAHGIGLLRGMEISCRYEGISVHLLSYLHDPGADQELMQAVTGSRVSRETRARTIVERLAADFPLTYDDVLAQAGPDSTIGRPHIADALVAAGLAPDRSAAFEGILSSRGKYYVPTPVISALDAIRMVHAAGGVAVFAHPRASARGRVVPDTGMRAMIEAGLDGLEIDHRDNPPADREDLRALAAAHDLLVTGSSDYHGTGKPNRLGEHHTAPEMLERIAARATGVEYLH